MISQIPKPELEKILRSQNSINDVSHEEMLTCKRAEEMKTALESHGGVKGSRPCTVVKLNISTHYTSDNKIPGIRLLNNFSLEKVSIRVWRSISSHLVQRSSNFNTF